MNVALATDRDVLSAAAGDRDAFVRLVEAYAGVVTSISLSIVRDLNASQDVAQDVFLVAWRDVRKLRNPSSFLPWLRQVTRNRANQWLRDQKFEVTERDADSILAAAVDHRPTAPELLERQEQQRIVDEVIDALPDEAREVITLFYKEGRSIRQVSDLLDLSEEVVKKRLSRARERIREEMLERFGETVRRAAPAAAIVTVIGAALTSGGPSAAAATTASVAKLTGASLLAKLIAAMSGAFVGASLGSLGVFIGLRKYFKAAADDQERRELRQFAKMSVAVVLGASAGIATAGVLRSALVLCATELLFMGAISWMYVKRLPAITARRLAAELASDPTAARRQRRQRIFCWIGLTTGVGTSVASVIWAIVEGGLKWW